MIGGPGTAMLCYVAPKEHLGLSNREDARDVRDYAAEHGLDERQALEAGMAGKSAEFREQGAEVYRPG
jgi:hypothetical protein